MRRRSLPFLGILVLFRLTISAFGGLSSSAREIQVPEKELKPELLFTIGSDKDNEDFYAPSYFAVANDGTIYVLDAGNSRVQCFSPTGKFAFSFGRYGQGPGELSKQASKLKILEDGNVYLIDNLLRRITIYTRQGKYLASYKINSSYDDITLKNKTYYLTNLILREDHRPIHLARDLSNIRNSIGHVIEPTPGILKLVKSAPIPALLENEFTFMNMTSILINSKGQVIYSQLQPYHLVLYDADGRMITEYVGELNFDTHFPLSITFQGDVTTKHVTGPVPMVYEPISTGANRFFLPVLCPDRSYLYLDVFGADCRFQSRYRIQNVFFDNTKHAGITNIHIDHDNNLYCLVNSLEDIPKLSKYKLKLE